MDDILRHMKNIILALLLSSSAYAVGPQINGNQINPQTAISIATFTQTGSGGVSFAGNLTEASSVTVKGNAFSVGGSTFAVIGGSVGIGVAIPQTQLQIFSANGADPEAPTTGGAPNGMLNIQTTNNVQMSLGISTSSNSGWIQVYNSPTVNPAFNLSLSPQGGNVGIGVLNCTTSNTWYHCVGGAGAVSGGLMYGQSGTEQTACTSGSGTLKSTAICSN